MANLTRKHTWRKWAPDVGENRELPDGPVLFLELATGLTARQLVEMGEALQQVREVKYRAPELADGATMDEATAALKASAKGFLDDVRAVWVAALSPFVRVHGGPHTVDGEPLATVDDYLRLIQQRADNGSAPMGELCEAVSLFNSVAGPDELFSRRSSGGARSTDAQSTAKAASPAAAP